MSVLYVVWILKFNLSFFLKYTLLKKSNTNNINTILLNLIPIKRSVKFIEFDKLALIHTELRKPNENKYSTQNVFPICFSQWNYWFVRKKLQNLMLILNVYEKMYTINNVDIILASQRISKTFRIFIQFMLL